MRNFESPNLAVLAPILASTAFVVELTSTPLFLPLLRQGYGLEVQDLGRILNVYSMAVGMAVLCAGYIGGLKEIRPLFTFGLALFLCGGSIVVLSGSYEVLLAGRMLQGFGGGFFSPLVPLLLTQAKPKQQGRILVVWGSISGFVAAAVPTLGGAVIDAVGWKPIYGLTVIISGIAILVHLLVTVSKTSDTTKASPRIRGLFSDVRLWYVYGYIFVTYGCATLYLFRLPLTLEAVDFSTQLIGVTLSVLWLSFSATGLFLRKHVDGPYLGVISAVATVLIALGFAALLLPPTQTVFFLSAAVMGAGFAFCNAPSTILVLRYSAQESASLAMSLDITVARFGAVCAVMALSAYSPSFVTMLVCVSCVLAFVLVSITEGMRWIARSSG